jgi:hypothetical protein
MAASTVAGECRGKRRVHHACALVRNFVRLGSDHSSAGGRFATKWFLPAHVVIGHANFDPVTQVYPQLIDILRQRNLQTVTLNDVFQV